MMERQVGHRGPKQGRTATSFTSTGEAAQAAQVVGKAELALLQDHDAPLSRCDPHAGAIAGAMLLLRALFRMRLRSLRQELGLVVTLGQVALEVGLLVELLAHFQGYRGRVGATAQLMELGLGLWSMWVATGAFMGWDGGWHFDLRPWMLRPGFKVSFVVSVFLAPTSALVGSGILGVMAGLMLGGVSPARGALATVALVLLVVLTLRVTASLKTMTEGSGWWVARASGYGAAIGIAAWNWLGQGVPPVRWFVSSLEGPAWQGLGCIAKLGLLLALMVILDGWLAWNKLTAGQLGASFGRFAGLLRRGSGVTPSALGRTTVLGWLRPGRIAIVSGFGGLILPIFWCFTQGGIDAGSLVILCGFALIFQYGVRGNLLGRDGAGVWRYACVGIAPAEVIIQRGVMVNVGQCLVILPTLAIAVATWPGLPSLITVFAFAIGTIALQDAAGVLVSGISPEPDPLSVGFTAAGLWILMGHLAWTIAYLIVVPEVE